MKKFLLFIAIPMLSFAQGVKFENTTLNAAFQKAKSEHKLVFLEVFTTWCGPCKKMTKEVFPDGSLGTFFNKNFINIRFDADFGEGKEIAKKYKVESIPTLYFMDENGKIVSTTIGFQSASELIELGRIALDPKESLAELKAKFNKGQRNSEFLLKLVKAASEVKASEVSKYCSEYFKTQNDLLTFENINIILQTTTNIYSKEFKYLSANESKAAEIVDKDKLNDALNIVVVNYIYTSIINENDSFQKMMQEVDKIFKEVRPSMAAKFRIPLALEIATTIEDAAMIEKYTIVYVNETLENLTSSELNTYAWNFFETVENKESLKWALKWALKSVDLDSNYYNNDTVANLCNKLGDKKNARLYALESIKLGEEAGIDRTATEELLKKL